MKKVESSQIAGLYAKLDEAAGRLTLAGNGIRVYTEDLLAGEPLLAQVTAWDTGTTEAFSWASFTARDGSARYKLFISELDRLIAVRTDLCVSQDRVPLRWMQLTVPEFQSVSSVRPVWSGPADSLTRPISFRGGLALSGKSGAVAFFGGEKTQYDPARREVLADVHIQDTGFSWFPAGRTEVVAFGGPEEDAQALLPRAKAFYEAVLAESAAPLPAEEGELRTFSHGPLSVGVWLRDGGIALQAAGPAGSLPLFRLTLRDLETGGELTADSRNGWSETAVLPLGRGARFSLAGWRGYAGLAMELSLRFPEPGRAEWTVEVLNAEQGLTVLEASYPPLPFGGAKLDCFLPQHSGRVLHDVTEVRFERSGIYPDGGLWAMGYFAVYSPRGEGQNGLYFGLHDPGGSLKLASVDTDPLTQAGVIFASCPALNRGAGGNAFALPGQCVWQSFSGDWYDAALLYRDFLRREAAWMPDVDETGRVDTPQWAKELPFWIMDWMPNTNPLADPLPTSIRRDDGEPPAGYWKDEALKLQRVLGVPIGYHVYNWHWIPFNNDYPHYFPVKEGFAEGARELEAAGVHVVPYINARLWDTRDREGRDAWFTAQAEPWATRREDGEIPVEHYESHEPDGSLCQLAPMCPSSGVWKQKIADILERLFREYRVSGVYLDQISAAPPYPCMARNHNHLPGGGSWWAEQYNLMLRRGRQLKGAEGLLISESNAEVYLQSLDGVLTWVWMLDDLVPAFPTVYSGYAMMLGRSCNGIKKRDVPFFRFHVAQQLLFGQQIGWINADVAEDGEKLPFLKKIVALRYRYAAFFSRGELLRPAEIESDLPDKYTTPSMWDTRLFELRQVQGAAWRLWDGAKTVLFLVNTGEREAAFTAVLSEGARARLEEGKGVLESVEPRENGLVLTGRIAACDALAIEIE